jgi:Lar family restriction alleviation protein
MSEELKPCPFCGSEAALGGMGVSVDVFYYVDCTDASCETGTRGFNSKTDAVDHWNRRAHDTLLDAIHRAVNEAIGGKVAASEIPGVIRERMK